MRRSGELLVLFFLPLGVLAGCGSDNPLGRQPVYGSVTVDGAPLASGSIDFTPLVEGGVGSGALIEGGKYSIDRDQGLPVGKYQVAITDNPPAPTLPPGHMPGDPLPPAPQSKIPPEWNSRTKQTIEVQDKGSQKFDFDIKTKKK